MNDIYELAVVGELALHVFSLAQAPSRGHEPLLQLGGGAGIILRHLRSLGARASLFSLTGADYVGGWLRGLAEEIADRAVHAVDGQRAASVVYVFPDDGARLWVAPGQPDPALLVPKLKALVPGMLVHVPVFPGFERVCAEVTSRTPFTVLDFGHFEGLGRADALARLVNTSPTGMVAQLNGAGLELPARRELLEVASRRGFKMGYVSAGAEPLIGYDQNGTFEITPLLSPVVCTMGAGDVLIAEIMHVLAGGGSFRDGCARGCMAATQKCSRWGI